MRVVILKNNSPRVIIYCISSVYSFFKYHIPSLSHYTLLYTALYHSIPYLNTPLDSPPDPQSSTLNSPGLQCAYTGERDSSYSLECYCCRQSECLGLVAGYSGRPGQDRLIYRVYQLLSALLHSFLKTARTALS